MVLELSYSMRTLSVMADGVEVAARRFGLQVLLCTLRLST